MANVLYLVHRLPYPPNKGDKVRSYHLLKHLASLHRVHLGTFIDDPQDRTHVAVVEQMTAGLHVVDLHPAVAKLKSLQGLARGEALSLPYYADRSMRRWVERVVRDEQIDAIVVFSSAMAQYVQKQLEAADGPVVLIDFVDVDSAKWAHYAARHRWPLSWLYRRESRQLLAFERRVARVADQSFFVTERESALFCELAPECAARVSTIGNGVDADYYAPDAARPSPFTDQPVAPIVFTGAMDYWPNVDAVIWFSHEVLPLIRQTLPAVRFCIVGRSPPAAVQALASDHVSITGTVPDVRPYLQHAGVVVAPLRVARGIQNKILEAMSMERPVVASTACVDAFDAPTRATLATATSAPDFAQRVLVFYDAPQQASNLGRQARASVLQRFSWAAHMAAIEAFMNRSLTEAQQASHVA